MIWTLKISNIACIALTLNNHLPKKSGAYRPHCADIHFLLSACESV